MAFLTVRLQAQLDDVGLYAGYLYAFGRDGRIRVYDWERLVHEQTEDGRLWNVAELAFVRNDVLGTTTNLFSLQGYGKEVRTFAKRLSKKDISINLADHKPDTEAKSPVSFPRDVAFYNGHLYLTGREGFFVSTIAQNGHSGGLSTPEMVHDFAGVALRAKFGVICISGGHSGVLCLPLAAFDDALPDAGEPFYADSVTSRKSSWMYEDILNVQLDGGLGYIDNKTERRKESYGLEKERQYITHLGERFIGDDDIVRDFGDGKIEMAFASNNILYALDSSWVMHMARKHSELGDEETVGFHEWRSVPFKGQVFDGFSMTKGLVLDSEEGTFYLTAIGRPSLLHPGENVTVRSFSNSRYYTRLIVSVKDDHTLVSCVWPELDTKKSE
jgi:hypothetical protein